VVRIRTSECNGVRRTDPVLLLALAGTTVTLGSIQRGARNESIPLVHQGDGLTVDERRPLGASGGEPRSPANSHADLDTRAQIHNMVVAFYRELVMDEVLGPIFEEIAEVGGEPPMGELVRSHRLRARWRLGPVRISAGVG